MCSGCGLVVVAVLVGADSGELLGCVAWLYGLLLFLDLLFELHDAPTDPFVLECLLWGQALFGLPL